MSENNERRQKIMKLRKRLLSGLVITPSILLAILFLPSVGMVMVIMVVAVICMLEFYNMLEKAGIPSFRYWGIAAGMLLMAGTYAGCLLGAPDLPPMEAAARGCMFEGAILGAIVMVMMVRQFPQRHNDKPLQTIGGTLLGVLYIPLLLNFFTKAGMTWEHAGLMQPMIGKTGCFVAFYLAVVTKITDAGAFFVGRSLGRHKMFPRISPGKTWEGLAGGIITAIIVSCILLWLSDWRLGVLVLNPVHAVLLGLFVGGVGVFGDLTASLMKRAAGVSDSGTIVPGIGGMLDVFDSLLFTPAAFYFYALLAL